MADGSVVVAINGDDRDLQSKLKGIAGTAAKTLAAGVAASAVAAGAALVKLGQKAIDARGEMEQNLGGSEAVFKEYAQSMQEAASDAYDKMGLSASSYLATANKMGALLKGVGFEVADASELTATVMQRASDVASIMGIEVKSAMEAVSGAAKGNFTMMDNLGVAINDTNLAEYALAQGITKSTSAMSTQEKVALAMEMFLDRTAYAAGNYAKENDTLAGSLTTAAAAWDNFLTGAGDAQQLAKALSNAGKIIAETATDMAPELIQGLGDLGKELAPELPGLIKELAPAVMEGASQLIDVAVGLLPTVIETVIDTVIPLVTKYGPEIAASLITGVVNAIPSLILSVVSIIPKAISGIADSFSFATGQADDLAAATTKFREEAVRANAELAKSSGEISATATTAAGLVKRLDEMGKAGLNTAEAQKNYAGIVAQLNELIPELNLTIDRQTGLVEEDTAAILENIDAWKKRALEQAKQDALSDLYAAQGQAMAKLAIAEQKRTDLLQAQTDAENAHTAAMGARDARLKEIESELGRLYIDPEKNEQAIKSYEAEIKSLHEQTDQYGKDARAAAADVSELDREIANYNAAISEYGVDIDIAERALTGLGESAVQAGENMTAASASAELMAEKTQAVADAAEEASAATQANISGMYEPWETAAEVVVTSIATMSSALDSQMEYWNSYDSNMQTLLDSNIAGIDELVAAYSDGSAESVNMIASIVAAYGEGTPEAIESIEAFIAKLKSVDDAQQGVAETAGQAAGSMVSGYYDGLMAGEETVGNAAHTLQAKAIEALDPKEEAAEKGSSTGQTYADAVSGKTEAAGTAAGEVSKAATDKLDEGKGPAEKAGENIIDGYITGLNARAGSLYQRISAIIDAGIRAGNAAAKIASPSKRTRESGRWIIEGYIRGMQDKADDLDDLMELITEQVLAAFPEDSDGYNAAKKFMAGYADAVGDYADEIQDAIDDINGSIESMTDKLRDYGTLTETTSAAALRQQIADIREYSRLLTEMQQRGASDSLMAEVADMSVSDAAQFANALLSLNDEAWQDYMDAWEEKQELAAQISQGLYQEQLDEQTELLKSVGADATQALAGSGEDAGQSFVDGIIAGMKARQSALEAAAAEAVDIISAAARAAGEIHSPSRLMYRTVGAPLAQGIAAGFEAEMSGVSGRMQSAVAAEMGAISARAALGTGGSMAREIVTNNNTIREKVVRVEGDGGISDELVRMLNLRLKAEDKRTGKSLVAG